MELEILTTDPSLAHLHAARAMRMNCRHAYGDPPARKTKDLAIVDVG